MATEIGIIKGLMGTVTATAADGSQRILQVGDKLFANEIVSTGATGAVEIEFADGSIMDLGRNSQAMLDNEVFNPELAAQVSEAVDSDVEALQQALVDGADPTQLGEATAAGAGTQAGNEGSSTVQVVYDAPEVTPTSGFDTTGINVAFTGGIDEEGFDDSPTAGITTVLLDEDDLGAREIKLLAEDYQELEQAFQASTGFNASRAFAMGVNDEAEGDDLPPNALTVLTGTLNTNFGNDGAGNILFNAAATQPAGLTSGGSDIQYWVSADGHSLVGYIITEQDFGPRKLHIQDENSPTPTEYAEIIFTAEITDETTGQFQVALYGPVDHIDTPEGSFEENLFVNLGFTISDSDGDTAQGILRLDIDDDSPVIIEQRSEESFDERSIFGKNQARIDEDDINPEGNNDQALGDDYTSSYVMLPVNFGADGPADSDPIVLSQTGPVDHAGNPITLTSNGVELQYSWNSDTATLTGSAGETPVISFTVTQQYDSYFSDSFYVDVQLQDNLDHPVNDIEDNLIFNIGYTATDNDGDAVKSTFTVNVDDDMPTITVQRGAVDEEGLDGGNAGDSYSTPSASASAIFENTTDIRIPGGTGSSGVATSTITVSGLSSIADLNVLINLNHTFDGDLDIFLISPNGTRVELTTDNGDSGDNFENTVFDDESANNITSGIAPFTGVFSPEGDLSDFDGENPNGIWTLEITDDAGGDTGTLFNWQLQIDGGVAGDLPGEDITASGSLGINWGADDRDVDGTDANNQQYDRSVTFAEQTAPEGLTSNGLTIHYTVDGTNLTAYTGTLEGEDYNEVFIVSISDDAANGSYNFTLLDNLDHPEGATAGEEASLGTEDDINLSFDFIATDSDGDSVSSYFTITVNDDAPVITTISAPVLQESFENLRDSNGWHIEGEGGATFVGDHGVVWTTNVAGIEIQRGNVGGSTASDGRSHAELDAHNNQDNGPGDTTLTVLSTTVTLVGSEATLSFDYKPRPADQAGSDMKVTLGDIEVTIDGQAGGGANIAPVDGVTVTQTTALSGWITVTLSYDGLTAGETVLSIAGLPDTNGGSNTLGAYLDNIKLDGNLTLQVDETTLSTDDSVDFSGYFSGNYGADSDGSTSYAVNVDQQASGLVDTETQEAIILVAKGTGIEGRTEESDELVFTVAVDADGVVTLDQIRAIDHGEDGNNHDSVVGLEAGILSLEATITDGDGDTATSSIDLGVAISFRDDGPTANDDADVETNEDTAINFNVLTNDVLSADGVEISAFSQPENGLLVLNEDNTFTYTPADNLHGQETFTYTLTDGDGDTSTATVTINVAAVADAPNLIMSMGEPVVTTAPQPTEAGYALIDYKGDSYFVGGGGTLKESTNSTHTTFVEDKGYGVGGGSGVDSIDKNESLMFDMKGDVSSATFTVSVDSISLNAQWLAYDVNGVEVGQGAITSTGTIVISDIGNFAYVAFDAADGGSNNDGGFYVMPLSILSTTNVIVNGSFEDLGNVDSSGDPILGELTGTSLTSQVSIPGWTTIDGQPMEPHAKGHAGVGATDGNHYMDLGASPGNSSIEQTFTTLSAGQDYQLSFDYRDKAAMQEGGDSGLASGVMNVVWNGVVIATIDGDNVDAYKSSSINVTATGNDSLVFAEVGASDDNWGIAIDNVQLFEFNELNPTAIETTYSYELSIVAALTDVDGSESLSGVAVTGLPTGVTITQDANSDGTYNPGTLTLLSDHELSVVEINGILGSVTSTDGTDTATTDSNAKVEADYIDFTGLTLNSWSNQDAQPNSSSVNANVLVLAGNSWKGVALTELGVDGNFDWSNGTLTFETTFTAAGEVQGIMFDNDLSNNNGVDKANLVQVNGTQAWGTAAFNSEDIGDGWMRVEVDLSTLDQSAGSFNNIVFANDDAGAGASISFRNLSISDKAIDSSGTTDTLLEGTGGDDALYANAGNDILIGGAGDDILFGGDGSDEFVWNADDVSVTAIPAHDIVGDFNSAEDVINLSDLLSDGSHSVEGIENTTGGSHLQLDIKDSGGVVVQSIDLNGVAIVGTAEDTLQTLLNSGAINDGI